ncbi:MAG: ABC transporter ATP-binding protein [Sphingobacteriales bacterium]|nr:MAG: ABC transporter ATP-binding protein [Sphingobacteriales bacterium]
MQPVIQVEQVSKQYRLGEVGTGTLSHDLKRWWYRARGKEDPYARIGEVNDRSSKGSSDYVWALQHINFTVQPGEVLGIIGRNGAGKSTLLKLLSKTTAPTTGRIKVRGRIASLLEVGTGFHPELTGRENIYLNGAILGMTRKEISRKFDEIVDFAGVERYIDTPVKRYSSGMYVRLAFAVAAHLEPEILIVDEVLAVGDAEFQKKCLGKMKDVSVNDGRTVLFVSHNMGAVLTLCDSGIMIENGNIFYQGEIRNCVSEYVNRKTIDIVNISKINRREGDGKLRIHDLLIYNSRNQIVNKILMGEDCTIFIQLDIQEIEVLQKEGFEIAMAFKNEFEQQIIHLSNFISGDFFFLEEGKRIYCHIQKFPLLPGKYTLNIFTRFKGIVSDWIMDIGPIEVIDYDYYKTGKIEHKQGLVLVDYKWGIEN